MQGFLYNTSRFGKDITRFVAPPYDVIDPQTERKLKEDRLNITHLTLGDESDNYCIVARRLKTWLEDGVLAKDSGRCFYIYEQTFSDHEGKRRVRSGIVGLVGLEEFSSGQIMPHEKTIPKHRADRLALKTSVQGDLEQIFLLYDDPTESVESIIEGSRRMEEEMRFLDNEGVGHRLIKISDEETISRITAAFANARILIADGHHRYEVGLEYRQIMRSKLGGSDGDQPYDHILATLVSFRNPGFVIFPTHRLVSGVEESLIKDLPNALKRAFDIQVFHDADALADAVDRSSKKAFGVWIPASGTYLMAVDKDSRESRNPMDDVPVYVVQEKVLKGFLGYTTEMLEKKINIDYVKGTGPTKDAMATGEYQACFFVRAPSVQQVMTIAQTGQKMPHKATYFFPKIWSGTVMHLH